MEDDWRSSQADMQEEVDAIILAHPRNHLDKILKMICGKMIGSFVLLVGKQDVISFCNAAGIIEINIQQITDSFDVFRNEITISRLERGRVLPCVARKSLLLLHIRFCYNLAVMLLVRSKQLMTDIIALKPAMRSRRSFNQLLNLDLSDEDETTLRERSAVDLVEDLAPDEPLERIPADQDPGIHLLQTLQRSGATRMHLLQEDEPLRPVELEEEPMFGMPAEFMWDTEAVINWLPEELRPSSLFGQEQVRPLEPEQKKLYSSFCRNQNFEKCLRALGE
ncbi:hypothetical protein LSTR_LSTR001686 [Laodelphax striatellus]|uniref:Uncharacterized protein n=1 Tax=Laodelphax striatellus TaxID=195883 RepID=A0A482XBT1_LAOST|nr:hypothetical protein LSTR_LSTR001686 [Laodelphax striatellus]